jgi:hypothetical protein
MKKHRVVVAFSVAVFAALTVAALPATAGSGAPGPLRPTVGKAVAFDVSAPLRELRWAPIDTAKVASTRPEFGSGAVGNRKHSRDGALQGPAAAPNAMPSPLFTFEGPSNEDNFNTFGFRVNPPDPNGDVGRNHVVFMVNLVFTVHSKTGALLGTFDTGSLWQGFEVPDCTDPSGDPIVLFDERANRWILTQFTTRDPTFYNCVAVSQTPDPLGPYFRFAFTTGPNFPDYPKYGVWPSKEDDQASLTITTREFAPDDSESIGIYAIEREALLDGDPETQVVSFHLLGPPNLVGDGLLPADFDGNRRPEEDTPQLIVGTQDNGAPDGATFDALNVFQLKADFEDPEDSAFLLRSQLPTAAFDSIYPCGVVPGPPPPAVQPDSRDCLPQPGVTDGSRFLDILSYRQRPTWRLQYRNFGGHESLVTNQSVEARPNVAGVRWYELRNPRNPFIFQQGTFAPTDGVHRWMGSVAMDRRGNLAAGYSVVNGTNVKPGIRYAGRLANDPLGTLAQGEATIINGTGVQTTTNSRWGDYTSMNIDPRDDCTFYYFNEYYLVDGTPADTRPWKTRVGAFRFSGCR